MVHKANDSADYRLDKKDTEMIKILEQDARIPLTELGRRLNLSHETVRYRLRKLEDAGIIEGYICRVNKRKLGYSIYAVIMIATSNYSDRDWKEFCDYLLNHASIISVEKITGQFDLKISFYAQGPEEMDSVSHNIKTRFSRIIKDWQSFIFTKQYKWKELPF